MAVLLVKTMSKQWSYIRVFTNVETIQRIRNHNQNLYAKVCIECHYYHTTPIYSSTKNAKLTEQKRRADAFAKVKERQKLPIIQVWKDMTVGELSQSSGRPLKDVLAAVSVSAVGRFDKDTVIANKDVLDNVMKTLGVRAYIINREVKVDMDVSQHRDAVRRPPPDPSITVKRHPVVTVMGHVDHGKTTLLDSLRNTSVAASEFGGITQHIGAFNVTYNGARITFLDTPGHAAFSAMRARGANVTDIVILVVAADDGVMEQTIQSIQMARDANVPIVVAINKIDRPDVDIERTHRMLAAQGILVEALGGDVQSVNISALKGTNLDLLMETVAAQAEIMNLRGDPKGLVEGVIIEGTTETGRGKLATALIQRGTLRKGAILLSGVAWAKVRAMFDHAGTPVSEASLSEAVQIIGWREMPVAGDEILEVENERIAKVVLHYRESQQAKLKSLESFSVIQQKVAEHNKVYKDKLEQSNALGGPRSRVRDSLRQKEFKEDGTPRVNVVIKADVLGSVEAILDVFDAYKDEERCRLDVVHYGIGPVTEKEIEIAEVFNATIYTFHVDTPRSISTLGEKSSVAIRSFKVIYKLIDDIKAQIAKQLPPGLAEQKLGEAHVLQYFQVNDRKKKVGVAGCRCIDGVLKKDEFYRILRNDEVIYEGKLLEMKHLKTDVKSVKKGVECGLRFEDPNIVVQLGDTVICYTKYAVPAQVQWNPGF